MMPRVQCRGPGGRFEKLPEPFETASARLDASLEGLFENLPAGKYKLSAGSHEKDV